MNFSCGVKKDPKIEMIWSLWLINGLGGSSVSNSFEYWYVPIFLLLPASGVLELWAALEIGCGPKPYPSQPRRGAQRQIPLITKTPNWAPGWKDSCPAWDVFRGLWRSLTWMLYGGIFWRVGEMLGCLEVGKGYEVCPRVQPSWGSCREFGQRETVVVCRRIQPHWQSPANKQTLFWKYKQANKPTLFWKYFF